MPLTERGKQAVASGKPFVAKMSDSEWDYRKSVALELSFAWQDARLAGDASTVAALERVMHNTGLEWDGELWWTVGPHGGKFYI